MSIKKIWKENKIAVLFVGVILLIILVFFIMIFPLYSSRSGSDYGNRLDGIEEVAIKDDTNDAIESYFKDTGKVEKVSTNLKGKLYNIVVNVSEGVDINEVINLAPEALSNFDEDQLKYYDFQIFITAKVDEGTKTVVGYKSKNSENVIWTNNK